jgi:hypothetical protein
MIRGIKIRVKSFLVCGILVPLVVKALLRF